MNKGGYTKADYVALKYIHFLFFLSFSLCFFVVVFYERPANKNISHCKMEPNYLKPVINDALIRRQSRMFAPSCEFTLRNRRLKQMKKDLSISNLHATYTQMHLICDLNLKKKRQKIASATYTMMRLISCEIRFLKCILCSYWVY